MAVKETVPMSIIRSISNFHQLFSSKASVPQLVERYWRKIDEILDLLKMVLEKVSPYLTPDDKLSHMLEELDSTIGEATKLVGTWDWMMSKIYFVMQVESTTTKMQNSVLEVCQVVNSLAVPPEANCISAYLEVMKKLLSSYK